MTFARFALGLAIAIWPPHRGLLRPVQLSHLLSGRKSLLFTAGMLMSMISAISS